MDQTGHAIAPFPEASSANADGPRGDVVSLTGLAALIGYHRDNLSDWVERRSLPVVWDGPKPMSANADDR